MVRCIIHVQAKHCSQVVRGYADGDSVQLGIPTLTGVCHGAALPAGKLYFVQPDHVPPPAHKGEACVYVLR